MSFFAHRLLCHCELPKKAIAFIYQKNDIIVFASDSGSEAISDTILAERLLHSQSLIRNDRKRLSLVVRCCKQLFERSNL